jgi:hypothetical protein
MAIVSQLAEETNLFTPRQIWAKDKFLFLFFKKGVRKKGS